MEEAGETAHRHKDQRALHGEQYADHVAAPQEQSGPPLTWMRMQWKSSWRPEDSEMKEE
jgi:hypothetical protein